MPSLNRLAVLATCILALLAPTFANAKALDPKLKSTFATIIGSKDDKAILETMSKVAPAPDGGEWYEDGDYRALSFSIGNGGGPTMKASPLGKLPVGIFYVGRGSKGSGPAFIKFTFLQKPNIADALQLVADAIGGPKSKLKLGKVSKEGKASLRLITGTKFVIYAVTWKGNPNAVINQIVIGTRPEQPKTVTTS